MKNKYYVPEISDIHVGYECEIRQMISNIGLYAKIKGEEDSYQSFYTPVIVGKEYPIPEDDEFTIAKLEAIMSNWYNKNPSVNQAIELLKKGKLQTPYLTKEQLEAEGWVFRYEDFTFVEFYKAKDEETRYNLHYDYSENNLCIDIISKDDMIFYHTIYNGECRCINDFKLIQKLLNFSEL